MQHAVPAVPEGGGRARAGGVVIVQYAVRAVPEGGDGARAGGVVIVQCAVRAVPEGGDGARMGGVVIVQCAGACGARGRRQGLAGLRDDAPSRRLAAWTASGRAAALGHGE